MGPAARSRGRGHLVPFDPPAPATPKPTLHTTPAPLPSPFSPPQTDFRKAKEKVLYKKKEGVPEGLYM